MTEAHHLLHVMKHLSPWALMGAASALSAIAGWAYLHMIRWLPWLNMMVLLAGLTLLIMEPVVVMRDGDPASSPTTMTLVTALVSLGAYLLTLGVAGRWSIRRHLARELLRRRLWDRISEQ